MKARKSFVLKRMVAWGLPAALILALILLALRPQPLAVDLEEVTRGELRVSIAEEGETRVRERFVVSAPRAGKLLRIELEPGDEVRADATVLAVLRPLEPILLDERSRAEARARIRAAEAALRQAEAERVRAEAEWTFARAERERYRSLAAAGVVPADRLEEAEMTAASREQTVRATRFAAGVAQHELELARAVLAAGDVEAGDGEASGEPIEIRSPVDGAVLRRLRESEATVIAGEPLLEVGDPRALEIVSDLLSTDAVRVRPGQRVLIEQWGGEAPLEGLVRRVEPYGFTKISALGVEEQRVNVIVDLVDPPEKWSSLGDGYRVEVRIVVWEDRDVLVVPASSLFRRGEAWAVWVAADGRAALRQVEVGANNGLEAQVLSGLTAGERTVVHPAGDLSEGARIEPRGL